MLVLSRRATERVMIGEGIALTVLDIRNGKVRLGIDAPPDVTILRSEVTPRNAAGSGQHRGVESEADASGEE